MKSKSNTSRVLERYGMIEPLEARIAPAALLDNAKFVTATAGGSLLVKAGQVLTTGSAGGGSYLLYVETGQVLVHTTDLNGNNQLDFNEITGLSMGAGARIISFVDIHGDVVTDLNPDGTLTDSGKGDILLDNNIGAIDLRSLAPTDFTATASQTSADIVNAHLAMSSYSIFGNIYAGAGLGVANDPTSGLLIDTSGGTLQAAKYTGVTGTDYYQASTPVIGSIYVGSSASGHSFNFGTTGALTDLRGNLLAFNPSIGEAGASIYNIAAAAAAEPFSIGTIHAGNGGFNAPGGNIVNVALQGDPSGVYKLIAGNAGNGTNGQNGGSIVNFSEAGTFISAVTLQSGNGGTGLTGAGGNGGNISYNPAATIDINAHFAITLGSGGDGYTKGGIGGSSFTGKFVTPEGSLTTALNVVTTMHTIGSIGRTQSFDFNGDGFSDAVFSTTSPNQVVVAFGDQNTVTGAYGLDYAHYIFLNAPANVDSIVVGDFNGDGHPDIAVASGSGTNAGIEVFLSQYNAKTGAFTGFSAPLFSPLPSLALPNNLLAPSLYYTTTALSHLVAGDFNGNGVMGLAVLAQETEVTSFAKDSVLIFLNGATDSLHPHGTGYFYANFNNGNLPYVDFGSNFNFANSTFEATALKSYNPASPPTGSHDVVVGTDLGVNNGFIVDNSSGAPSTTTFGYGQVDTDETVGKTSFTNLLDLTLTVTQDSTSPNIADIVVLSKTPLGYLDVLKGGANGGNFTIASGNGVDQAGFYFGQTAPFSDPAPVGIVAVPIAGATPNSVQYSNVAILDYNQNQNESNVIYEIPISDAVIGTVSPIATWFVISPGLGKSDTTVAFDSYIPHPIGSSAFMNSGPLNFGFVVANNLQQFPDYQGLGVSQPKGGSFTEAPFKTAGYYITAGNGGNSQSGSGGAGGSLGQSLTVTGSGTTLVGTGTLSIEFPVDLTYQGSAVFTSGNGGNGFTNGGAGGNIAGVSVTYLSQNEYTGYALLNAGSGGESLTGIGGAGGSLSQLYIITGEEYLAGNGGVGVVGGAGGSVLGNTQTGLLTSQTNSFESYLIVAGGDGATGITGGGNGGSVSSFVNAFIPLISGLGGELVYFGGAAGDAVAGQGGHGGSIINSSPSSLVNNLAGDIFLETGAGGNGKFGGDGGTISNFSEIATIKDTPTSFTIVSGVGGNATLGAGGHGGNISNVFVSASGATGSNDLLLTLPTVSYNRLVAGQGGSSAGGSGGSGGSVTSINTASVASNAQNVVAAGAGGQGLTAGGSGGNVSSASVDAGSTTGKVIVIAGDGGASTSVKPASATNPQEIANAIGGVNGPGGAGGSITNFTQSLSTNTHVDLIAGNGGATINHSVAAGNATTDNSGNGGSITNVSVAGSIGNSDPAGLVPIKSYNDILDGQTMQNFVDTYILENINSPGLTVPGIDDTVGNVGLVAGAAGRVEGGLPSSSGINGYVTNVHAENIMSMIAGNVDQVDLIQRLTNYGVTINGGVLGADKVTSSIPGFVGALGQLDYISANGLLTTTPLPGGGALIDGAILAKNIRNIQSARDFQGTQP